MSAIDPSPAPRTAPVAAPGAIDGTAAWLARVRRTARGVLVTQRVGWVAAWVLALLLVAGAADFVLRTPDWLRTGLLLVGVTALIAAVARVVWPAVRFHPSLTEIALRVERTERARAAGLGGVLASGLELGRGTPPSHDPALTAGLARPVVADAARKASSLEDAGLVSPKRALRSLGWAGAALASVLVVAAVQPALARIGAERLLWPWGGAEWPKRTGVADVGAPAVHPLGTAFALRAAVTRAPGDPEGVRVAARYRLITDGREGPVRRVLLTAQGRTVPVADNKAATEGSLYERLIEPAGLTPTDERREAAEPRTELEYWFETDDDATDPRRVLLVEPPEVIQARATIRPPAYAAAIAGAEAAPTALDLGPGSDERAAPAPILAGSRLRLTIELNKPVPIPRGDDADVGEEWLTRSLGPDAAALFRPRDAAPGAIPPAATFAADTGDGSARWVVEWTLSDPVRLLVKATDEHGISSPEESVYRFDSLRDNPPTATVTEPQEDKSVLATAVVELGAEARDDVGLAWLGLEGQRARKPETSEGAAPEPIEEPTAIGERVTPAPAPPAADAPGTADGADARRLTVVRTLDLSTLELKPGDEVWLTALATDAYELDGVRHEPVRSSVRRLRILSREQLIEQVWSELGDVRRTAIRLDEDQAEVGKDAARPGAETARRGQRSQSGITERLARQAQNVEAVRDRLDENGLDDEALEHVLNEAKAALQRAGQGSLEASDSLGSAAEAESAEGAPPEAGREQREQAADAQEAVRREMANLVDLLDQGEDTWASKRALEQILREQQALRDKTAQTGQVTTGKPSDALTPQERQSLEQIAQEQDALADRLREAIDKMLEREQKMRQTDPAAAQTLAQAARRGQREQTAEKMEQASQQAGQNQTNNAQQQQQQAIESMESMLNELEQTAANRDEVLKRYLASLIESIEALIAQQQRELKALAHTAETAPEPATAAAALADGMIRLHQNTLGVQDEAANGPREVAPVADLLGEAAGAQASAVVPLRSPPVEDLDPVARDEQTSLDSLTEARDLAQRLEREAGERQQDRKRAQLRKQYEEALRQQNALRESSQPLVGAEASRRNRSAARLIGQDQDALRTTLQQLHQETQELKDAKVFDFAHKRLDELMTSAAQALQAGLPDAPTLQRQTGAARLLQGLVDALDNRKKDRPFREGEQGGGGGSGGQGEPPLVPPAAEVKLLRAMQQEVADLTRALAESGQPDDGTLDAIGRFQNDLATYARDLLERIQNQGGGPAPEPAPEGEQPEGDEPPAPPEGGA